MSLLGKAALAMWWEVDPAMRADFEHWHSHEHFAERMAIPGFRRGSRWRSADGGDGFFVLYELEGYEVLASQAYLARLNAPTPWSTRMMPHHRNMVRSQCRVLESRGGNLAGHALTVRLSPSAGREQALLAALRGVFTDLVMRPGMIGAHLLQHQTPAIPPTEEQRMRGHGDRVADWVLVVTGYDPTVLLALAQAELGAQALARIGAAAGAVTGLYVFSSSATPGDFP